MSTVEAGEGTAEGPPQRTAERLLGTVGSERRWAGSAESVAANSAWWDADADDYHVEHGEFLGVADFVWCPEAVREEEARLLGEVAGKDVVEIGCGSAPCARWLVTQGARVTALDLSAGMLRYAAAANEATGVDVRLVRANAERLPFASETFDIACSAFGAIPFVADLPGTFREIARVLRPGGSWVFAVTHPMRWIFPDDPGPNGLHVTSSYFDRTPYVEVDADGHATYVEHHRTLSDFVRALTAAGLNIVDLVEPEWPDELTEVWGQWSPLRGELFPGTAIFVTRRSA
jgi:SAM-dependent methyltransferase